MQKVLEVNYKMDIGGIETFLMNVYRNIDKSKYELIFLTYNPYKYDYEDEILKMGGKIIKISNPRDITIIKHIYQIYKVLKEEKVDVVHAHTYFDSAYVMIAAYLANIKVRIVHSHTAMSLKERRILKKIKWFIARIIINLIATEKIACSTEAGKALFGASKFQIICNGIKLEDYSYNKGYREKFRKEFFCDEDTIVLGHVGRFDFPKNHEFLIRIMKEIVRLNKNTKLILVGSGKLRETIEKKIKEYNLESNVILLGNRNDVNKIINSFDIFVFPSIYEGLPVSLIEAQANGLTCLVSKNISEEVKLANNLFFEDIKANPKKWAEKILEINKERNFKLEKLKNSKYEISKTTETLEKLYVKSRKE